MPNAISLTAEYCPRRRRATIIMIMFTGFSIGAAAAGLLSAWIIPVYGWRTVLLIGGILSALLWLMLFVRLPELIRYLVLVENDTPKAVGLLKQVVSGLNLESAYFLMVTKESVRGTPIGRLIRACPAIATVLLWAVFF